MSEWLALDQAACPSSSVLLAPSSLVPHVVSCVRFPSPEASAAESAERAESAQKTQAGGGQRCGALRSDRTKDAARTTPAMASCVVRRTTPEGDGEISCPRRLGIKSTAPRPLRTAHPRQFIQSKPFSNQTKPLQTQPNNHSSSTWPATALRTVLLVNTPGCDCLHPFTNAPSRQVRRGTMQVL